jgi:hypothetical protein
MRTVKVALGACPGVAIKVTRRIKSETMMPRLWSAKCKDGGNLLLSRKNKELGVL